MSDNPVQYAHESLKNASKYVSDKTLDMFDAFSLVHATSGYVLRHYIGLDLKEILLGSVCFELWENSPLGISTFSPAKWKKVMPCLETLGLDWEAFKGDSAMNTEGDNISVFVGAKIADFCHPPCEKE